MSETVAFRVTGESHEACIAAAIARLPTLVGGDYDILRSDTLVPMGGVTWALASASTSRNVMPGGGDFVCDVVFERHG